MIWLQFLQTAYLMLIIIIWCFCCFIVRNDKSWFPVMMPSWKLLISALSTKNEMTILVCILHLIVCVINMSHVCIKWILFYPADSILNNGSTEHKIFLAVTYQWLFADAPDREAEFESKSAAFEDQANQIADTAVKLANAGGNTNKRLLDQIRQNAEEVSIFDRFVSFGAAILLSFYYNNLLFNSVTAKQKKLLHNYWHWLMLWK